MAKPAPSLLLKICPRNEPLVPKRKYAKGFFAKDEHGKKRIQKRGGGVESQKLSYFNFQMEITNTSSKFKTL